MYILVELRVILAYSTSEPLEALEFLKRKQNDATALAELDKQLRKLDPNDPVKYDFALFGLSAFEKDLF